MTGSRIPDESDERESDLSVQVEVGRRIVRLAQDHPIRSGSGGRAWAREDLYDRRVFRR